ncbi:18871_t:CDS:2, partial [Gigaspora rosea]
KQDHDKDILFLLRSALPGWSDVKYVTDIEIERVSECTGLELTSLLTEKAKRTCFPRNTGFVQYRTFRPRFVPEWENRTISAVPKLSTGKVIPEVWANINKWYDMSVKLTTTEDKKKAASMKS